MQARWFLGLIAVVALATAGGLVAEEAKKVDYKKIKCVVSGKPVNPEVAVDYKDAKVYLCCEGCPGAFKKDTAKFASKANHQLVATHQAQQEKCPISGEELDPATELEIAGVKVSFCCDNCKGAAEGKEGDEKLALVFGDKAFEKGFKIPKKDNPQP